MENDFIAFIERSRATPFAWGQRDCCLFAADWLCLQTGVDFAQTQRGHYSTEIGAKRMIKKMGFRDIETLVNAHLGEPCPPLQLNRGDIALVNPITTNIQAQAAPEPALGIVWGDSVWVMGLDGVMTLPFKQVLKGWKTAQLKSASSKENK